jgi:hypothetical protein
MMWASGVAGAPAASSDRSRRDDRAAGIAFPFGGPTGTDDVG